MITGLEPFVIKWAVVMPSMPWLQGGAGGAASALDGDAYGDEYGHPSQRHVRRHVRPE